MLLTLHFYNATAEECSYDECSSVCWSTAVTLLLHRSLNQFGWWQPLFADVWPLACCCCLPLGKLHFLHPANQAVAMTFCTKLVHESSWLRNRDCNYSHEVYVQLTLSMSRLKISKNGQESCIFHIHTHCMYVYTFDNIYTDNNACKLYSVEKAFCEQSVISFVHIRGILVGHKMAISKSRRL